MEFANTLDEVVQALEVQFPYAVQCRIDVEERRARIPRIELKNTGEKGVPAGWRGQICIFSGIDRRFTLVDTIVLPTILPGVVVPLGPYEAEIPADIASSGDEWNLELYIADPRGNRECLFRSPAVSFT